MGTLFGPGGKGKFEGRLGRLSRYMASTVMQPAVASSFTVTGADEGIASWRRWKPKKKGERLKQYDERLLLDLCCNYEGAGASMKRRDAHKIDKIPSWKFRTYSSDSQVMDLPNQGKTGFTEWLQ